MEPTPRRKKDWILTEQSLGRFLSILSEDPAQAGEQYELIRRKLVKFFEWRGSATPQELADETLNRLMRKIDEGEAVRNLSAYLGGVARLVWLEAVKAQERERGALESWHDLNSSPPPPAEAERLSCFESCLEALPAEHRALILDYYRAEKRGKIELRKQLAARLGTPLNALRIRAHRIRMQLEKCINDCLRKAGRR